jgi:hypothetical protein
MKVKWLLIISGVLIAATIGSFAAYDGTLTAVDPDVTTAIHDSSAWYTRPEVVARPSDPDAVYLIAPALPDGKAFAAVRISSTDGAQRPLKIELGPSSGFRPCLPGGRVRAIVHGVRVSRPSLHLMTLPDGKGPGLHSTDSATGRIDIVFDGAGRIRRLLTERAFNSTHIAELLSSVSVDPGGHWIAATRRDPGGWTAFVFRIK